MKKLEISQMERMQGGSRQDWCLVGAICMVGVGLLTGPGMVGALTVMGGAASALGC